MCTAIALPADELPDDVLAALRDRVHTRDGGAPEVRFHWRAVPALLPVLLHGRLRVVRWGNKDRQDRRLPPCGWTWRETVEAGKWAAVSPEPVEVPARYVYAGGVWTRVKEGVQGLVVHPDGGEPLVYLLCEPSTRYYRVMTRCEWMPVLIGEVL